MKDNGELARRLKSFRKKSGLNMTQVSKETMKAKDRRGRLTQGYISRLESGRETNPSMFKILSFCRIYKISPDHLLKGF